jgi:hypothetical protein
MALDVGLQHAISDGHSQSGFSIPSLLKGRCPAGASHLTQKIARPAFAVTVWPAVAERSG